MSDQNTTLADARSIVSRFVDERDWKQFHHPKNLAMSIAIEAAELMEHFQWMSHDEVNRALSDQDIRAQVTAELADVFSYSLAMANALQIDVSEALADKMKSNEQKYPVEQYRGRYGPSDKRNVTAREKP